MNSRELSVDNYTLDSLFNYGKNDRFYNAYTDVFEELNCLSDNRITLEGLLFYERNQKSFLVEIRNNNSPITIKNCAFKSKLIVKGTSTNNIIFDNVIFEADLSIDIECQNLKIINCQRAFSIECSSSIKNDFTIADSIFNTLYIRCVGIHTLTINQTTVLATFTLTGNLRKDTSCHVLICNQFKMLNLTADDTFRISEKSQIKGLVFESASFAKSFVISNSTLEEVSFSNTTFKKELIIETCEVKETIKLSYGKSLFNAKILNNSYLHNLVIGGNLSSESTLNISDSLFKEISFENFKNTGLVKLSDIRMDKLGSLKIRHSNLGKAEIYNSNFSKTRFEFEKSQISEIFISETDFPEYAYIGNDINYGQGKLAFGQLQTVFQRQGDSVRSYEYLAREVKNYYKQITLFSNKFFTKINLFLNCISNDFGRNWILGFVFSFGIGFVFFYFLILSTKEYSFGFPINFNWNFTESFLKFMNPLRHFDTDDIFKNSDRIVRNLILSNWSYLWDFLGRIFVAYGYYQTIQAFRKFGRR